MTLQQEETTKHPLIYKTENILARNTAPVGTATTYYHALKEGHPNCMPQPKNLYKGQILEGIYHTRMTKECGDPMACIKTTPTHKTLLH